jgi:ribosome-binding protein aMBF1 (putative translation factor)
VLLNAQFHCSPLKRRATIRRERKGGCWKKDAAIAEFARIVSLYDAGEGLSIAQLAERFQKSNQMIRYILTRSGVLRKRNA